MCLFDLKYLSSESPAKEQHLPDGAGHREEDGGTGLRHLAKPAVEGTELGLIVGIHNVKQG